MEERTSRLCLTVFTWMRTSCNFLLCIPLSGLFVVELAKELQKTAKRQNTTSFIFSVSGARVTKMLVSKVLLEMQTVVLLTFLYLSLRTQENHSQRVGNLRRLVCVSNEIFFSTGSHHYVIREWRQAARAWGL